MTILQAYDKGGKLEFYSANPDFLPYDASNESLKLNYTGQPPNHRYEENVIETPLRIIDLTLPQCILYY